MKQMLLILIFLTVAAQCRVIRGFSFRRDTPAVPNFRIESDAYREKISDIYDRFINDTFNPRLELEFLIEAMPARCFRKADPDDLFNYQGFDNSSLPDIIAFSHSHGMCRLTRMFHEQASFSPSQSGSHAHEVDALIMDVLSGKQRNVGCKSLFSLTSHHERSVQRCVARWQAECLLEKGCLYRHDGDPLAEAEKITEKVRDQSHLAEIQLQVKHRYIHVVLAYGMKLTPHGDRLFFVYDPNFPKNPFCSITFRTKEQIWISSHYGKVYAFLLNWH